MFRWNACFALAVIALPGVNLALAADAPPALPTTFELMINGETFQVEANRMVKLPSTTMPGVTYEVALRVAPIQVLRLNTFKFSYDLRSKVQDDRGRERRTARVTHELGLTMLLTDLGEPLDASSRDKALELLSQSVAQSLTRRGIPEAATQVTRLEDQQFAGSEGRGVRFRYRDAEGVEHVTLVYLLVGKQFTASCIVQYLQADAEDVLPIVKRTLDSVKGLQAAAPAQAESSPGAKP